MFATTFDRIAPAFRKAGHIHLQGWGEPLLHPDLFGMARTAKEMGCSVGTTTNGMLWSDRTSELAVEGQIDVVGFSLAGTEDSQDAVRVGTRLSRVLQAIESVKRTKDARGSSKPHVHVAYMLLRSGLAGVLGLPRLLEGLGVEQVVVGTLDFVPDVRLAGETLVPEDDAEEHRIRTIMDDVVSLAAEKEIYVHYRLPSRRKTRRTCTENVLHALCVSVDGDVSPCVYTNPAVHVTEFGEDPGKAVRGGLVFGNVNRQSVGRIWRESSYKAFRRSHERGDLQLPCSDCTKMLLDP